MFADMHIHTAGFSGDAQLLSSELAKAAGEHPGVLFCTAEHYDYDYPEPHRQLICDIDRYSSEHAGAKACYEDAFSSRYPILFGIEYGYQNHLADYYDNFSSLFPFDCVIGSVHMIGDDNTDPYYYREVFLEEKAIVYRKYLEGIAGMLRDCRGFDIVGHYDYISRYSGYPDPKFRYREFPDLFDEIFRLAVAGGRAIELNTSSSAYLKAKGHPDFMPDPDIFIRYRELGGEMVSFGSDAHRAPDLLRLSDEAAAFLRRCGFRYLTGFREREPFFYEI